MSLFSKRDQLRSIVDRGPKLAFSYFLEGLRCRGSRKQTGPPDLHCSAECLRVAEFVFCLNGNRGLQQLVSHSVVPLCLSVFLPEAHGWNFPLATLYALWCGDTFLWPFSMTPWLIEKNKRSFWGCRIRREHSSHLFSGESGRGREARRRNVRQGGGNAEP